MYKTECTITQLLLCTVATRPANPQHPSIDEVTKHHCIPTQRLPVSSQFIYPSKPTAPQSRNASLDTSQLQSKNPVLKQLNSTFLHLNNSEIPQGSFADYNHHTTNASQLPDSLDVIPDTCTPDDIIMQHVHLLAHPLQQQQQPQQHTHSLAIQWPVRVPHPHPSSKPDTCRVHQRDAFSNLQTLQSLYESNAIQGGRANAETRQAYVQHDSYRPSGRAPLTSHDRIPAHHLQAAHTHDVITAIPTTSTPRDGEPTATLQLDTIQQSHDDSARVRRVSGHVNINQEACLLRSLSPDCVGQQRYGYIFAQHEPASDGQENVLEGGVNVIVHETLPQHSIRLTDAPWMGDSDLLNCIMGE